MEVVNVIINNDRIVYKCIFPFIEEGECITIMSVDNEVVEVLDRNKIKDMTIDKDVVFITVNKRKEIKRKRTSTFQVRLTDEEKKKVDELYSYFPLMNNREVFMHLIETHLKILSK